VAGEGQREYAQGGAVVDVLGDGLLIAVVTTANAGPQSRPGGAGQLLLGRRSNSFWTS